MATTNPLTRDGAVVLALHNDSAFAITRQANAISLCVDSLPKEMADEAMLDMSSDASSITDWFLEQPRVFIVATDSARLFGVRVDGRGAVVERVDGEVRAVPVFLTNKDLMASSPDISALLIRVMAIARETFPAWAADKASEYVGEMEMNYVDFTDPNKAEA